MTNDLISREDLRKAFHERIWHFDKSSWDEANALINNAPAIDLSDIYKKAFQNGEINALKIRGIDNDK